MTFSTLTTWIVVPILAFFIQWFKTMLGMGWGTVLSPVLLAMKYDRETITISLLIVELASSIITGTFHFLLKNVSLRKKDEFRDSKPEEKDVVLEVSCSSNGCTKTVLEPSGLLEQKGTEPNKGQLLEPSDLTEGEQEKTYNSTENKGTTEEKPNNLEVSKGEETEEYQEPPVRPGLWGLVDRIKNLSTDTKIILILGLIGASGTVIAVLVSDFAKKSNMFKFVIKEYIGISVLLMGVATLLGLCAKQAVKFAYWKVLIIAIITGFNKGISGGGSGPIAVTGLILIGRPERHSIGVTPFSEMMVCATGTVGYMISNLIIDGARKTNSYYSLAGPLFVGAVFAIPFAAFVTKRVRAKPLKVFVGVFTIILGIFSITQSALSFEGKWFPDKKVVVESSSLSLSLSS